MRAIGYIRVSTDEQAQSGLSLEHQRAKIEAFALATDIELVAIESDNGKSAKNLNRPALQRALAAIRGGQAEALIVLKLDRLTRSVKDLGELVELFDKTGAALISVQDSINTTTAAGRLVLNVLGSVAQWEREAIGERTKAAMSVKKAKNERVGAIPYGFDLAADGKTLVENPTERDVIKTIVALHDQGLSFRKICSMLSERGIPSKEGKPWQAGMVQNIFKRWKNSILEVTK